MEPFVQKQYDEYRSSYVEPETLPEHELRERIIEDLSFVSKMSIQEYTLYQKWLEIQMKYPTQTMGTLFGEEKQLVNEDQLRLLNETRNKIWFPDNVYDFEKLEPEMIYTDIKTDRMSAGSWPNIWNCIRTMSHTQKNSSNIGRNLHYVIRDRVTEKYLGVICITGDFIDLTPRDDFIGWDREYKTNSGKLNSTCIGSSILPTQPFGYNYVGGKLLALLCLSDDVQRQWKENYGDTLVSVTTTSLYGKEKTGGLSQYDRLKYWKKMGYSSGSVSYELHKNTEKEMLKFGEKYYNDKFFNLYVATRESGQPLQRDHRNRFRQFMFSKLNIPKELIKSDHGRGIYFSTLYDNTREFLRGEIEDDQLIKSFDTSVQSLTGIWKSYARKRIESLQKNGRTNLTDTLFYDDVPFMSWEETKQKYLAEVGR